MKKMNLLCTLLLLLAIGVFSAYYWNYIQHSDNLGPVITMEEEVIEVSVNDGEDVLMSGLTAYDIKDGDVTDSLMVEEISEFIEKNTRRITYAAFDSDRHVSKATRMIVYTDYHPVEFSLDAPFRFPITNGNIDILGRIHGYDCLDGDVSKQIEFSENSMITVNSPGTYRVTLEVTNSAGDLTELPVNIVMYDTYVENSLPHISLTDYLVYTNPGEQLDPLNYVSSVIVGSTEYSMTSGKDTYSVDTTNMNATERKDFLKRPQTMNYDNIQFVDGVDYDTPGVYEIRYTMMDKDDRLGQMSLIVVVREER